MPEAWKGLRVPGRKKARIAWCVSTWLTKTTQSSSATPRLAVSPVVSISSCMTARARSTSFRRRRKAEPMR